MIFEKQLGVKLYVSAWIGALVLVATNVISESAAVKSIDMKTIMLFEMCIRDSHYNWHGETEILILLKGQMEMSCNGETFTMEPLDVVIISPQVGHATLALEENVIAFVMHVGNEFYQQYDPDFGAYQFVLRSDNSTRHNQFFTTLRHHAAMTMLLMTKGESPVPVSYTHLPFFAGRF